ncbi:MAG: insulinase family protein [Candidatus Nealsonbacteria bacterium]|nr:insulinase family protein [Candidatus Nealsonbacteria bacterium]
MFKKITLKNGLRIITVPQKHSQSITIFALVGAGSKYELKEINGISHFIEHMFFKGTKKRPNLQAVSETLDKIGGIYNAFTSEEYTGYFAKVEASHFDLALDWVSDIFLNSVLPEKEIEKEKRVIIEEINMYYDIPMSYVQILWPKLLYGNQPAGWPVAGTKESVTKISRQDLINYLQSQYVAQNTLVCLAGKFEKSSALAETSSHLAPRSVIEKVKKHFSEIGLKKPKEKLKVFEKQTKPNLILHTRETDQTHLCLGVRGYNLFHPQKYALELLGVILGGMFSSRLSLIIRGELGIAYYISTNVETDTDTGYLVTQAGIDNKNVEKAISTILKEYKKISQKGVEENELKKAKDYTKGKMALILETSDAQASFYGFQELLKKEILTPDQIYKKIDKITENDILKTAGDIFKPEKLNLALIGPFKDKRIFQQYLRF